MKKRGLLKQLLSSTARAGAAVDEALEYVEASEKRMRDTESSHVTRPAEALKAESQHYEADNGPLSDKDIASVRKSAEPMLPVTALKGMIQRRGRKVTINAMRPQYKLSDLLAQMDPNDEIPDDVKAWADMKPGGKEIWWSDEPQKFRQARARYLKRRRGA